MPTSTRRSRLHALVAAAGLALLSVVVLGRPDGAAAAAPGDPAFDDRGAQSFVDDYIGRHGLPGAAYVVVKDGRTVAEGAAGDVEASTPMSVGSLAKGFTAFAVLQLVDEDLVELDAPVTTYLQGFSVGGADPSDITVRRLLSHTSGLPDPLLLPTTGDLAEDVAHISELDVVAAPGTGYAYSNLNYRTLARLVEVVSGESFADYLEEHVFAPLGMHDTRAVVTVTDTAGLDAGHVTAYGASLPLPELRADVGGAGGVISTAHDMGAWLAMQQRGGVSGDGSRLLSEALVAESHTAQPGAGTYGMGWQHTRTASPARIGHDGSLTRYSSRMDLVPSSGYGTAVLLDSYTPTFQHPFSISTGLIEISEGRTPEVGFPVATALDLALAGLTLLVAGLGARGVVRSRRWAERRRRYRAWRLVLRHLPHLVLPAVSGFLLFGLTSGTRNPATPLDAYGLWPAATGLVLVGGVVGIVLVSVRSLAWRRVRAARVDAGPAVP
ncbi:class A beta-lactamase-related serine hydrolase [Nocardioides oleivorans]|uniref:Class A beta-lactamase-related serine hydrolase n=1 Tax=Nocardioides oleivorans TaxID=273676 RepID=A0A4Q2RWH5_9ACTN|nr:serine hydrolase domain-containing protein [Nocardioides oleivorans]RYB93096.1 class A beta-lactamase-related serine hydrolase [Nocardioides oleivorans]